jgi:hypothetical protein
MLLLAIPQGSPQIVKTGRLDFSLSWLKGEVRENLGDFRKLIQIIIYQYKGDNSNYWISLSA